MRTFFTGLAIVLGMLVAFVMMAASPSQASSPYWPMAHGKFTYHQSRIYLSTESGYTVVDNRICVKVIRHHHAVSTSCGPWVQVGPVR